MEVFSYAMILCVLQENLRTIDMIVTKMWNNLF